LLLLSIFAFARPASAAGVGEVIEGFDFTSWQNIADESGTGLNVRALVGELSQPGELPDFTALISELAARLRSLAAAMLPDILLLVGPALLWAINRSVLSPGDGALSGAAGYVCYLVAAAALIRLFSAQLHGARQAVAQVGRLIERASPILTALTVAVGGVTTGASVQPMGVIAASLIATLVRNVAFALCGAAAILAVIGNLHDRVKLQGLYKLTKSTCNWLMGAAMVAFLGVMTVNGMLGSAKDGVSIRTAKFAVDELLPVVGGEVADAMDAMILSSLLVKNAAGVTGLIVLLALCFEPIARLTLTLIVCRLSAAVIEPIAEGPLGGLMEQFAGVCQMLLVALATAMALFMVLVGVVIGAGNAVVMMR